MTQNYWRLAVALVRPPTRPFRIGNTNMLVSKNAKICVNPNAQPIICITPNVSQWNIGCAKFSRWAHTFLFFCVSISFTLGPVCQWNMDLMALDLLFGDLGFILSIPLHPPLLLQLVLLHLSPPLAVINVPKRRKPGSPWDS